MDRIVVLDFGSQYAHLIAKRLRASGFYTEIAPPDAPLAAVGSVRGIILSGGPASVFENPPPFNTDIFTLDIPILGLCYGHQLLARSYGGTVEKSPVGEYGLAALMRHEELPALSSDSPLFSGIPFPSQVWMSHQDAVTIPPPGFTVTAFTKDCAAAAIQRPPGEKGKDWRFGLQFHAEVKDTLWGERILVNFAEICGMPKNWTHDRVLEGIIEDIRRDAGEGRAGKKVLLFLSGGVDSTVAFALLNRALGSERVLGLHIDNGFMRKNESLRIEESYRAAGFTNFIVEDASDTFLAALEGLTDPQKKRSAVGETFIAVRNIVSERLHLEDDEWLLAQGTLYPDIIESGGSENARTIKTHHNRVSGIQGLIEKGLIIEPLKDLYKDEVRTVGRKLGLDSGLVMRHPFPGPGLSINVLCSGGTVDADFGVAAEAAKRWGRAEGVSGLTVLPVRSVGVQGDFRTYCYPAVISGNADEMDYDGLEAFSGKLTNAVKEVNRLVVELFRRPGGEEGFCVRRGFCDRERLDQTREADAIVLEELHRSGWYARVFQHLTINLPYAGAPRHCSLVLRPVVSEDVMTARFARLPPAVLGGMVKRIAALPFVDAVYYDVTNKPPATFAWE